MFYSKTQLHAAEIRKTGKSDVFVPISITAAVGLAVVRVASVLVRLVG